MLAKWWCGRSRRGNTPSTRRLAILPLASRLQTLASPGAIAVSEGLRKLVEGYFTLRSLGPARIKGVSEPVNVYELTRIGPLRTRLQRSAGRGLTKFVGRQREMEAMRHAAEQAKSERGQIVAAMAEPGVGKSRLFFEFKATSQSGWMVLETVSVSHGKASAYLPVIDLLRNYFDITAGDDERKRREKVTGRVVALDRSLEDALPYVFSLLGIVEGDDPLAQMDGQIKKRRTLEAIKRILLRESLNLPLMVVFEDLHWIDDATQELLNLLADSIGTAKLLLLVNYRPEYSHQWNSKTYYTPARSAGQGERRRDPLRSFGRLARACDAVARRTRGDVVRRPSGRRTGEGAQQPRRAQTGHHRTHRRQPLLHGRASAVPLRRRCAAAERNREARQVDERVEGPRHSAS